MEEPSAPQKKKLEKFKSNLLEGITYYQHLFTEKKDVFKNGRNELLAELEQFKISITGINTNVL
ncbi:hypothetical protein ACKGJN_07290 [Gillisia sp. Q332]|uniref:hypothetical protein n=1 Tax=Gillisia xinjiangensis TaxID=3384765 RepID=UPI00391B1476